METEKKPISYVQRQGELNIPRDTYYIQTKFLKNAIANKNQVNIILADGTELIGIVLAADSHTIQLNVTSEIKATNVEKYNIGAREIVVFKAYVVRMESIS